MDLSNLNHRDRRAYLKKLKRKKLRVSKAKLRDENIVTDNQSLESEDEELERKRKDEELKWLQREEEAKLRWQQEQVKIQSVCHKVEPVKANGVDFDPELPPWHHPPPPVQSSSFEMFKPISGTIMTKPIENCSFFRKTGSCRFGFACSRLHAYPNFQDEVTLQTTGDDLSEVVYDQSILVLKIPKMFTNYHLNPIFNKDAPEDQDSALEIDESQLLSDYYDFYYDVRSELESKWGKIVTLRTCRNQAEHLRGCVYVEFARGPTATWDAAEACNGRWFGKHQLSCNVVRLNGGWREAVCGLYYRGKCPKGDVYCNFLHVFLNPGESVFDLQRSLSMHKSNDSAQFNNYSDEDDTSSFRSHKKRKSVREDKKHKHHHSHRHHKENRKHLSPRHLNDKSKKKKFD